MRTRARWSLGSLRAEQLIGAQNRIAGLQECRIGWLQLESMEHGAKGYVVSTSRRIQVCVEPKPVLVKLGSSELPPINAQLRSHNVAAQTSPSSADPCTDDVRKGERID